MKPDFPPEIIAAQLEEHRRHFEAGDKNALIQGICFSFDQGLVAPEWIVKAFFAAINKWYSMHAKTLDEAFEVQLSKGANLNALKKRRRLKFAVLNAVNDARARGEAVDDELFETIGAKLGIGKTLVKEYLRAARAALQASSVAHSLLESLKVKTPKPRQRRKLS